jgi:hypothetical protein
LRHPAKIQIIEATLAPGFLLFREGMRMAKATFIVRSSEDGWMVQRQGKKKPESIHKKKEIAVKKGRTLAKRAGGYLKIKAKGGKVQAKRYYGD